MPAVGASYPLPSLFLVSAGEGTDVAVRVVKYGQHAMRLRPPQGLESDLRECVHPVRANSVELGRGPPADVSVVGLPASEFCQRLLAEGKVMIYPGVIFSVAY